MLELGHSERNSVVQGSKIKMAQGLSILLSLSVIPHTPPLSQTALSAYPTSLFQRRRDPRNSTHPYPGDAHWASMKAGTYHPRREGKERIGGAFYSMFFIFSIAEFM